jgi:hypothetical protein
MSVASRRRIDPALRDQAIIQLARLFLGGRVETREVVDEVSQDDLPLIMRQ